MAAQDVAIVEGDGELTFVEQVAANVRAAAGRRNVRQADLVRGTSISRSSLSRKWTGRDPFDTAELEEIANLLRMPVPELLATTRWNDADSQSIVALAA